MNHVAGSRRRDSAAVASPDAAGNRPREAASAPREQAASEWMAFFQKSRRRREFSLASPGDERI
jgi:hypothetical protein